MTEPKITHFEVGQEVHGIFIFDQLTIIHGSPPDQTAAGRGHQIRVLSVDHPSKHSSKRIKPENPL